MGSFLEYMEGDILRLNFLKLGQFLNTRGYINIKLSLIPQGLIRC